MADQLGQLESVVVATGNQGKLAEIRAVLAPLGIEAVSQKGLLRTEPEETGTTFVENALIKAHHLAAVTGLPVLADDSGLVVDALAGAPGVRSAPVLDRSRRPSLPTTARCFLLPHVASVDGARGS